MYHRVEIILKALASTLLVPFALVTVWAASPDAPGVPNFHQVNDHVYRGGQPSKEGWNSLAQLGVKTVIDLRQEHPDSAEARAVKAAGMMYVNVPLNGYVAPSDEQVAKVLALFDSADAGTVFVHCRRGADRTGTIVACYRIKHDHWDNEKALEEAKSYGMARFEIGMKHYVLNYRPAVVEAATPKVLQPVPAVAAP